MKTLIQFTNLSITAMCLCAPAVFAQNEEPATALPPDIKIEESSAETETVPAGQDVEVNEDNYRQFMELKDPHLQRNMLPENAYKSQTGTQKLDELPEESQKHLRDQLREIILQGDQWEPGDEETEYPYVPSVAAATNQDLKNQEAEAWSELLGNYHQREAEIYQNASRSQAAAANTGTPGKGTRDNKGATGEAPGQSGEGQQSGQESDSGQNSSDGSYSPGAASDPNASSTAGVAQNAMEFLNKSGNESSNGGGNTTDPTTGNDGQAESKEHNQAGQQTSREKKQIAGTSPGQNPGKNPSEESTSGTSQNALEYLMQDDTQSDQSAQQEPDTLTIEELLNARGIRGTSGTGSPSVIRDDEDEPVKKNPDKNEDG